MRFAAKNTSNFGRLCRRYLFDLARLLDFGRLRPRRSVETADSDRTRFAVGSVPVDSVADFAAVGSVAVVDSVVDFVAGSAAVVVDSVVDFVAGSAAVVFSALLPDTFC